MSVLSTAARVGRLVAGRLLILALTGLVVILACQIPVLLLGSRAPVQTTMDGLKTQLYWRQVLGYPQRMWASAALHAYLADAWARSSLVLAAGLGLAILLGTVVGIFVAARAHGLARPATLTTTMLAMAVPDFLIVVLVQRLVVTVYRHFDVKLLPILSGSDPRGWIMPGFALGLLPAAFIARMTVIALDDIQRQDYIRTARSKGLHPAVVLFGHALKNAVPRTAAALPQAAAFAVSALLPVEWLTNWPGLGFQVILGYDPRYLLSSVDEVTTAALGLVVTYLVLDLAARGVAAVVGRRAAVSEAEAML